MKNKLPAAELNERIARELAREHQQRILNDEARTGLGADEDVRLKDARQSSSAGYVRRPQ